MEIFKINIIDNPNLFGYFYYIIKIVYQIIYFFIVLKF